MTPRILCAIAGVTAALGLASAASAQQTTASGQKDDWSYFASQNPKECWAVTSPKSSTATRNGQRTTVQRGDIRLYVTYRGAQPEVSFAGGYPFAGNSTVTVDVGGSKFEMFTDGEWAWPGTPADDQKIVAALKGGAEAVVSGKSQRGTDTRDVFSLKGVTASIDEAAKLCR